MSGVSLGTTVVDLERFLDIIVGHPFSPDDGLALRVIGRGQDLGPSDEPWMFELVPTPVDAGFEFRAIANIPHDDVAGVVARLDASAARDDA